jgi:serine/threonine-protein kinase
MNIQKFKILGTLGEGGMATVYKAMDPDLDRLVAIKELADHLRSGEQALKAFRQEAKLLAQLSHPNVVGIYSVLEDGGRWYLVMEYVEGQTLASLIRKGPLPLKTAIEILQDVLSGLKGMHEVQILHRDLKPANILLDQNMTAKISDFGIAQRAEDEGRPMNFGSVKYMAPELYKPDDPGARGNIDPRSDIYALGIIAYEMLLGDKGFRAECQSIYPSDAEIRKNEVPTKWINWHLDMREKFRPLSEVNPSIPAGLSKLVERMTSKDLGQRYQDVASVISDLKSWASLESMEMAEDSDATLPVPGARPLRPGTRTVTAKPKSRTTLYVTAGVSFLLFFVILIILPPRKRPVSLRVISVPQARVTLDEGPPASAGEDGVVQQAVPAGHHRIKVTADPYEPYEGVIDVPQQAKWELNVTLKKIPPPVAPQLPPVIEAPGGKMLLVSAGEFIFGNENRKASLAAFYIDETEVTNFAYRKFCDQTGHPYPPKAPWDDSYFEKPLYPVVNVSWSDAVAFAQWAGKRLPTELEWEKAARGTDGRIWPWGSVFDPMRANLAGDKDGFLYTAPVGSFPSGRSPYGALDMAGNVWEWVADAYDPATGRSVDLGSQKVLKGGAFLPGVGADLSRTFVSGKRGQSEQPSGVGFRCAKDASVLAKAQ